MKRSRIEWLGGLVSMPESVDDEGERYRPEMLIWMGGDRVIVGTDMGKPGEVVGRACASLQQAIVSPIIGRPHAPTHVRVASPELAKALRSGHPGIDFVCAPTPELDAFVALMLSKLREDEETEESYLAPDIGPDAVAALFHATAALFRAKPWNVVPGDQCMLSVDIADLGVREAVVGVIGQNGRDRGFLLFSCLEDVDEFLRAGNAATSGEESELPPHLALSYVPSAALAETLRSEISEHRWEIAGPAAIPLLLAVDDEGFARPFSATEVRIFEAIALALPKLIEEKKALFAAWNGGQIVERTFTVATQRGNVRVSFRVPYRQSTTAVCGSSAELSEDLRALDRDGDVIDNEALRPLLDRIERSFATSPEAEPFDRIWVSRLLMDYAAMEFGVTPAALGPTDLHEIIFEIIPRKVTTEVSSAQAIIAQSRAFFAFLKREYGLEQADACLRVLKGDAVERLEAALSDTTKFGMAKSMMMRGLAAGYDVKSEEGLNAWMLTLQSEALLDLSTKPVGLPSLGPPLHPANRSDARAKKNQRKAARRARKKNR